MCDKTCIFFFFPIINKYFLIAKFSLLSRCPLYMNTSECYNILVIAIHVHENGTVRIHIHSSLFSVSFVSCTFQTMADYSCQQIAAETTVKQEHLYHLEHYPLSYGVPVRERYGSTLLPATREQHDQNCTQSH